MNAPVSYSESALVKYDAACRAIAEAGAVDEILNIRDTARAMAAAAKIAKDRQAEADLAVIRFRAERRVGELLAGQKDAGLMSAGGRPSEKTGINKNPVSAPITLAEAGIDKNLASRARKYAAISASEFEEKVATYRDQVISDGVRAAADLLASKPHRTIGTGENEWYTPHEYVEAVRNVLGKIDLDPASCAAANETVKAVRFFDQSFDGLKQEWSGKVFLNPPYAQPDISNFIEKLITEWRAGRTISAICLTHNFTDTRWHHRLFDEASALCFTSGRIKFVSPKGEFAAPTNGQTFAYFGPDVAGFRRVFSEIGAVVSTVAPAADETAPVASANDDEPFTPPAFLERGAY